MNIKNFRRRTLGLLLLFILLAVGNVVGTVVPTDARAVYVGVNLTLLAVACVVAGYFLRTLWALVIVPVVFWGEAYLFGLLLTNGSVSYPDPNPFQSAVSSLAITSIFLIVSSIPIVLLTLLGVLLGKRSARTGAALAVS